MSSTTKSWWAIEPNEVSASFETEATGNGALRTRAVTLRFDNPLLRGASANDLEELEAMMSQLPRLRVVLAEGGGAVSVQLQDPSGLNAGILQRFPWARWLIVAEGLGRLVENNRPIAEGIDQGLDRMVRRAMGGHRVRKTVPNNKRPGRAGHPDSFYQEMAARYQELRQAGSLSPTATLASETGHSRNTVAGWVRTARTRGFLPEARGNRPG